MTLMLAERARFAPVTPDELISRWVIVRSTAGTLRATHIFEAGFDYVAGFTAAILDNDTPISISWSASDSGRKITEAVNVPLGTELILATDEEIGVWISEATAMLAPGGRSLTENGLPRGHASEEMRELVDCWERERSNQAAFIAAM